MSSAVVAAIIAAGISLVGAFAAWNAQRSTVRAQRDLALANAELQRSLQRADQEVQRSRDLQQQLSGAKYEMYQPMIDALGAALVPGALNSPKASPLTMKVMTDFSTWITMFGSDDAVRAFRNFQQGSFNEAPSLLIIRLFSEFMIAARRDIGEAQTSLSGFDLMSVRITDIYADAQTRRAMTAPWSELEVEHGWQRPWSEAGESAP